MVHEDRSISARTLVLLGAAVLCCALGLAGAIGTTQAQLTYHSQEHRADIEQTHLGIALIEKTGSEILSGESPWRVVAKGEAAGTQDIQIAEGKEGKLLAEVRPDAEGNAASDLLILGGDAHMVPGKTYPEAVSVRNASADQEGYVRVTLRRYWSDDAGNKLPTVDPALIELDINDEAGDAWVFSEGESTPERLVYYLKERLPSAQDAAYGDPQPLITGVRLSSAVAERSFEELLDQLGLMVTTTDENGKNPVTTASLKVNLFAQVDAVQTHNAPQAAKSAWGVDVDRLGLSWGREEV